MPEETIQTLKMLYCYAPEDRQWVEEIDLHFKDLNDQCHIISQFDGELLPGRERKEQLLAQFPETDLVLLLISPHFRNVEAFWDEISHEWWAIQWLGWCRVIVLLLSPVAWSHAPFASREVLPRDVGLLTEGLHPLGGNLLNIDTVSRSFKLNRLGNILRFLPKGWRPLTEWRNQEPVTHSEVFPRDAKPLTEWQNREQAFQSIEQQMRVIIEKQWLDRGDFLNSEGGEWKETLAAYNEALRLNPSVKEAWYGKGNALSELERYEEALSAYDEALRLDPLFSWAWYCKGGALSDLKRYEEALSAYDEALRLDPSYKDAWYWKGEVLKTLGRKREARQAQKKARQLGWP